MTTLLVLAVAILSLIFGFKIGFTIGIYNTANMIKDAILIEGGQDLLDKITTRIKKEKQ